jgi:hypothetical protein
MTCDSKIYLYDIGNPGPGLWQIQNCEELNLLMSHNVVLSTTHHWWELNICRLLLLGTDYIDRYISTYHTNVAMTTPKCFIEHSNVILKGK